MTKSSFGVIIAAGGTGSRFGGSRNKILEMLGDKAVVRRAVEAFLCRGDVARVAIATADRPAIVEALGGEIDPRIAFCPGGRHRAQSVRNALAAIEREIEWVAVHDAARPLVSQELIDRTLAAARQHGAAVAALPVHLTIKQAQGPLPARVQRTVPRETLWAMQTPQIVRRADLERAFETCPIPLEAVTDDVQLIELMGGEVWLVDGEQRNLKITRPMDLKVAELVLRQTTGNAE
jgi:2-C-methyl-D-erythritol 4-phosphate cytidylyltransferase